MENLNISISFSSISLNRLGLWAKEMFLESLFWTSLSYSSLSGISMRWGWRVGVCVCVCVRKRGKQGGGERNRPCTTQTQLYLIKKLKSEMSITVSRNTLQWQSPASFLTPYIRLLICSVVLRVVWALCQGWGSIVENKSSPFTLVKLPTRSMQLFSSFCLASSFIFLSHSLLQYQ